MIPADVARSLQVAADTALRPVAAEQDIADRLSGLVAGQKVVAQIQALLPNGTYRALVNQRSITLALPFSARSGDSLELLVTESDGKLALAIVGGQGEDGDGINSSARATLSRTGQLISTLLSEAQDGNDTAAVTLNANQPIGATPVTAQELLPQLRQAITQSGMFYEAHQAEWVEGRLTQTALLQEPQGKLLTAQAFSDAARQAQASVTPQADAPTLPAIESATGSAAPAVADDASSNLRQAAERLLSAGSSASEAGKTSATTTPGQLVAPQTQALVQQQLEALATQNFSWQGQVWAGQEMRWEIEENSARDRQDDEKTATRWSTRLHLTLPTLGEVDAQIRLQGNQITLSMAADSSETRDRMRAEGLTLRSQFEQAGIVLTSMGVAGLSAEESDGQGH